MIRDQNYVKVAEYTQKAFQVFAKRVLASRILSVLDSCKNKKQMNPSESQILLQTDSISKDFSLDKQNSSDQNELGSKNTRFNKQQNNSYGEAMTTITKIGSLKYGEYIFLDLKNKEDEYRVCSVLDSLKMFNSKYSLQNVVNMRRSCFQICSTTVGVREKVEDGEEITNSSLICLKNVFTGHYIHLTHQISNHQFGYCSQLKPAIEKQAVFQFRQAKNAQDFIFTDEIVSIVSYYRPDLNLAACKQHLGDNVDYTIIGSYKPFFFSVCKMQQAKNIRSNPYYLIHCVDIDKNLSAEQPSFRKFVSKREFNKIEYETENQAIQKEISQQAKMWKIFSISNTRFQTEITIEEVKSESLCQIWEIERVDEGDQGEHCFIKNVIFDQPLKPKHTNYPELNTSFQKSSLFQFQPKDKNHFTILNDQKINLTAFYDRQTERYILKYDYQKAYETESIMGKGHGYRFQLVQLEPSRCMLLYELIQMNEILKYNYGFIEKWGFRYEEREFKLKYLISQLKSKLNIVRCKIEQVVNIIERLKQILLRSQNNMQNTQLMIKQFKILEILIFYCRIIKLKSGSEGDTDKSAERLACQQLKQLLLKIFDIIYYLVFNNKVTSQIIIQNTKFFSFLLFQHPEPIGLIIEESIKNLCILNTKTIVGEEEIFKWTNLIEPLNKEPAHIQKKYIDIIAEVVVDTDDIGILSYQNKIKQLLLSHRSKKKIIPRFGIRTGRDQTQQPIIIFQYDKFPIFLQDNTNTSSTKFQLRSLYKNKKTIEEYTAYEGYICSFIKLLRNLCKDRNKKLAKIVEDYGLTQAYLNLVFRNNEIGWQLIAKFLSLYCSIHIVQDPFLSFQKRSVKCFSWNKIDTFDFTLKTSILFSQFTEQSVAQQKLKAFDANIFVLLDRYFNNLQNCEQNEDYSKGNSFFVMVSVLYEIVDYGYLSYMLIQKYVKAILNYVNLILKKESKSERQENLILKIVKLISLAEQIWTTIQGMSLLKTIYNNLCLSKNSSIQYLVEIKRKALNHDEGSIGLLKRSLSCALHSSRSSKSNRFDENATDSGNLDVRIIQFALSRIVQNKIAINKICFQQLMNLVQLISQRGQRISSFLDQIFILNSQQQQNLYLEYSGITPLGVVGDSSSSSRRLQNVMKVKELVDKITIQNGQRQDEPRKKEKILELNNLLIKIINNLTHLKEKHYELFKTCQLLLQKLKLHQILIQIMKYHDRDEYQLLIGKIITFYIQFIHNNVENLSIMAAYFSEFTKRYSYEMLPDLLPSLFTKTTNQDDAFWLVYRNLDKKMDSKHREIVFQCIYGMVKVCPLSLFQNIKGQIIYNLASNSQFSTYINSQICSPSFISLICLVGQGSPFVIERISSILKKSDLLQKLKDNKYSYFSKWIYLRLYHYLYIQQNDRIDEIQLQCIVSEIIIEELKRLPASCHNRASVKLTELKQDSSMLNEQNRSALDIESQYRSLVIDASAKIEPSEQQPYFIYLLNIDNQRELSLLTFLQDLLTKYQISGIEPLANYLFKIINFMQQIFQKQEKAYQSRILNKLYEISVIIYEKYNRNSTSFQNLTFKSASLKVQSFFGKLSQIVLKQNITYFQLLKCAGVTPSQVQSRLTQNKVEKLIVQTDFQKFMAQLSEFVNNRSEYNAFASQSTIKQFYMLFKQKGALKLNIINFISKLIQVLDYDKSINLVNTFSSSVKNKQLRQKQAGTDQLKWKRISSEVLKMQIKQLRNSFEIHLKDYMCNKICNIMRNIIQTIKPEENKYKNILQIHQQSCKYSIMNLVANQILIHLPLSKAINNVDLHSWQLYFKFIASYIQVHPQEKIFDVLDSIYNIIHQNQQLFHIFVDFFVTIIIQIYSLIKVSEQSRDVNMYKLYKKAYSLISKILSNHALAQSVNQKIQIVITQNFIDSFAQYTTTNSIYWFNITELLLQKMVEGFDKCTEMVRILSDSSSFINNLLYLINAVIKADLMNTNIQSQNRKNIQNQLLKLIKKFNVNGFQTQLSKIIAGFPYCLIYGRVKQSYNLIKKSKQTKGFCDHHQKCSQQFCNELKATDYDEQIVNFIINLLIIMHIAACLVNNPVFESKCSEQNMQMLTILHKWKTGTIKSVQDIKYFRFVNIVKSIEVYIFNQKRSIYYNVPFLDKFHNLRIEEQIQQDLTIISQQNFFQNLYFLSIQAELKIQDYFSQLYITTLANFHYACILYLCLICLNQIQSIIDIPKGVLYALNSIIIIMKICIFGVDLKKFISSYKIVDKIQFIEYAKVKKYSRLILSFSILVSYGLQNMFQFLYSITFCLEISKIIIIEQIIIIFLKSFEIIFYPLLFCQSFVLVCCYYIYQKVQNYSIITVFITLEKQIMLYNSIFIDLDQPDEFIMLKQIPALTTLFYMLLITLQAIFMAKVIIEFGKLATRKFQGNKICKICGRSKEYFESKRVNFNHHRQYQHNVWNYIQYFISMRRKLYLQSQDKQIKSSIDRQDFRFLKIDYHL